MNKSPATNDPLTEEEVKLYDRQIRLWGLDAQQKIARSHILIYGLDGVNQEVTKNLAAGGFNLVFADDRKFVGSDVTTIIPLVDGLDLQALSVAEVTAQCAKNMNKFLKIQVIKEAEAESLLKSGGIRAASVQMKDHKVTFDEVIAVEKGCLCVLSDGRIPARSVLPSSALHFYTPGSKSTKRIAEIAQGKRSKILPHEAAIVGGVISQQIRAALTGEKEGTDWNVGVYDQNDCAFVVAKNPEDRSLNVSTSMSPPSSSVMDEEIIDSD